jgi:homoserine kinase
MDGYPAVVSGAGPSVMVLATGDIDAVCRDVVEYTGATWQVRPVSVSTGGVAELDPASADA